MGARTLQQPLIARECEQVQSRREQAQAGKMSLTCKYHLPRCSDLRPRLAVLASASACYTDKAGASGMLGESNGSSWLTVRYQGSFIRTIRLLLVGTCSVCESGAANVGRSPPKRGCLHFTRSQSTCLSLHHSDKLRIKKGSILLLGHNWISSANTALQQ